MSIKVPECITTPDSIVNVLQLSDLHLYADIDKSTAGIHLHQSFIACLNQALADNIRCDLILVTGDLVNEIAEEIYDRIFAILDSTGIEYACVAGNHDVTDELNQHLPFNERTLVPYKPDDRLIHQHCIVAEEWHILLLDSSIPGAVGGEINADRLKWLEGVLASFDKPTVIFMHHHTHSLNCKWLDLQVSKNSDLFWQLLSKYPQVKAVVNGHVHQENTSVNNGITVFSTPSTCYQFKKHSEDFALDRTARPGYRWLQLKPDTSFNSWVDRLVDSAIR